MKKLSIVVLISCILLLCVGATAWAAASYNDKDLFQRGKVLSIKQVITEATEEFPFPGEVLEVEITSGKHKGRVVETFNAIEDSPIYNIKVHAGQRVILSIEEDDLGQFVAANISDVVRDSSLLIFGVLFVFILLIVGGKKGMRSLVSLALSIVLIFTVMLPLILRGFNPMLVTIGLSAIVTAATMVLIGGVTRKTIAATLGVVGGATCAGLLAYLFGNAAHLTGLGSHEAQMLGFIREYKLNVQGILFASMLIGALGAVMDVGMSIASAIEEVYANNPIATPRELFNSGMNVGRDIMGTMSNTLILAYTGGSLPLLLILTGFRPSFLKSLNMDMIASEIVRALAGSVGMFVAIPLTALFSVWLIHRSIMKRYYN